jgi:hypothetical protein
MKTAKMILLTAATLVALSGLAFSAEDTTPQGGTTGTGGGTCTDCFDP